MNFQCFRLLTLLALSLFAFGCGGSDKSSSNAGEPEDQEFIAVSDVDLTGTWLVTRATETYKEETGEYLYTTYVKYKYVLEDTPNGVKNERCWELGGAAGYGVKTLEHYYMYVYEDGFKLQDMNTLIRRSESKDEYSPGFVFRVEEKLERISKDTLVDDGYLMISGANVNVNETDNVCYWYVTSTLGVTQNLEIMIPYLEEDLSFSIQFRGNLEVGEYEFDEYNYQNQITDMNVHSSARDFWDSVGSNILAPDSATVEITVVEPKYLEGNFSFVGQDMESYTGSFSIQLP
ncbi:MAG: hypothetical protein CMK89_00875 [Pseudomonadales bacterium]|nr:hypothetical protein [Pseudomonadales bacterium]